MESGVPAVKPSLLCKIFLWVETGEPGVKPPEPVIDVWRHQCLTHKVVTSSCSVFLVNLCLLLVTNQLRTGGEIANQIIKPEIDMNAWIHR